MALRDVNPQDAIRSGRLYFVLWTYGPDHLIDAQIRELRSLASSTCTTGTTNEGSRYAAVRFVVPNQWVGQRWNALLAAVAESTIKGPSTDVVAPGAIQDATDDLPPFVSAGFMCGGLNASTEGIEAAGDAAGAVAGQVAETAETIGNVARFASSPLGIALIVAALGAAAFAYLKIVGPL